MLLLYTYSFRSHFRSHFSVVEMYSLQSLRNDGEVNLHDVNNRALQLRNLYGLPTRRDHGELFPQHERRINDLR